MNKKILFIVAFIFSFARGYGQVSDYVFSESQGTYSPLTAATVAIAPGWDDQVTGNSIPIGFSFGFDGTDYTTCSINSNGYITFGTVISTDVNFIPIPISSTQGYAGAISALGIDIMDDNSKPISYSTVGVSPNRIFTIQWDQIKRYVKNSNNNNGQFNFQIKLFEINNSISFVYGACFPDGNVNNALNVQVGLRGATNMDYNNRSLTTDNVLWDNNTVAGTSNTAFCRTRSTNYPTSGRVFSWTPKPKLNSFTPSNACSGPGTSVLIAGTNFSGATAVTFNGVLAIFTVNSNTQITAQLPTTATTGAITVTTPGGTVTSSSSFTVNAVDGNQTSYGVDSWIGYVYANTNGGNPPSDAFTTAYRGYVTQSEIFDSNLGNTAISGSNLCGTYIDNFAVRYKMTKNLPEGCYTFTVGGDDGYRLSIDGGATFVVNNWTTHAYQETTYSTYLNGNVNFVLEYFESADQSRVRFSSAFSALSIPVVGTNTPPTCVVPTGSVALSSLPAGTWTINASPNTPGLTGLTGSIDNTIIGGLAQGTSYTFTVSDVTCTSMPTAAVVVGTVETITSSDGVTWTSAPTISKIGTITAAPSAVLITITSDTELCSCTISLNTNVEVASGVTLKLQDKLTVNGSLTFKNNASLVQDNDVANTGVITYERETAVDKFDYTYWSSPVSGQTLYNTSKNTLVDKYFSFDAVADDWKPETPSTKVMDRGVGYIIRGPQDFTVPSIYTANFIGVPNNGTIPVAILATDASYLLGNPYPSALDADLFLQNLNNKGVIDGTLYFWTHNTDIAPSGSQYIYVSADYASYNLLGGVGTAAASDVDPIPKIPTGEIASGQGFFATSIAPGTVNFTNTMRLGGNVNTQFFRSNSKSKKNASIDKSRLWLNFSNTEGAFKQTLIGYATGATNEYERKFDGISFDGNTYVDFYSVLEDKNFVIQGRALPFLQSDLVPLGYNTTIAGTFTITIFQTDGFLTTQDVFLEDKMRGVIHNLKESPYSFATEKGVFNERFVLRYTDKTLGTGDVEIQEKTIVVFKEKNELKIKSEFETMKRVTVFDLLGKKVFDETLKDVNEFRTSKITLKNQIVIVKVVLTNGHVVTKKVSY